MYHFVVYRGAPQARAAGQDPHPNARRLIESRSAKETFEARERSLAALERMESGEVRDDTEALKDRLSKERALKLSTREGGMPIVPDLESWAVEICPGHPIDLGIVRAVKLLRDAGFETFEACEGGGDHAYAEPTVRFEGTEECGRQALAVLAAHGLPTKRLSRTWDYYELTHRFPDDPAGGTSSLAPFWEVTFESKLS